MPSTKKLTATELAKLLNPKKTLDPELEPPPPLPTSAIEKPNDLPGKAAIRRELARRELARRHLLPFILRFEEDYKAGWVHKLLCTKLERFVQAILRGESPRLMVFMPPRAGKSLIISKYFPAWLMARYPKMEVILASYAAALAQNFSKQVRGLFRDEEFKPLFPKVRLDPDSQSSEHWFLQYRMTMNDSWRQGGSFVAAGVGGPVTGKGANCVVAGSLVETDRGAIPIEEVQVGDKVLTYNENTGEFEYKGVEAVSHRKAARLRRITTAAGRVLEVTPDHRVYAGGEWVEARFLTPGVAGLCVVPHGVCADGSGFLEERGSRLRGLLLLRRMFAGTSRNQEFSPLSRVRRANSEGEEVLQDVLAYNEEAQAPRASSPVAEVPYLQFSVFGCLARASARVREVLYEALCRNRTLCSYVWLRQPAVETRSYASERTTTFGASFSADEAASSQARFLSLRRLWQFFGYVARASFRQRPDEQRICQLSDTVRVVPSSLARSRSEGEDSVALVEDVYRVAVDVYDLQIEGNHNFFANGILVHNCLIIDDPVKNAEEADSQLIRDNIWDWYTSTAYTRLAPGGGIVIVMTRWHEDDLAGRLERMIKNGELDDPFEILRFPAIAEEDEEYRKAGEALHPERFDKSALERIRKAVGPRVWAALYQQRPAPEEGAYFTRDMFQYYEPHELPKQLNVYATWDLAIGKKERNDFTVGVKFGVCEENKLWILDVVRARMDALEIVDSILDMWESDPRFMMMGIEAGHIQMALGPLLDQRIRERRLFRFYYEPLKPGRQDKEARARSIQGRMRQGLVYWPSSASWLAEAREELLTFPHGTHDDVVDAVAYAGILLDEFVTPRTPKPKKPHKMDYLKAALAKMRLEGRKRHWLAS